MRAPGPGVVIGVTLCVTLLPLLWPSRRRRPRVTVPGGAVATSAPRGAATSAPRRRRSSVPGRWRLTGRGRRRRDEDDAALLALLDLLAPALRAGLPVAAALDHMPAVRSGERRTPSDDLGAALVLEAADGRLLSPVWTAQAQRSASPDVAFVAAAWTLSDELGAPLADAVAMAALSVRQGVACRQRLDVAVAGPRATATLLTGLPLVGPLVGLVCGISPAELYSGPALVVALVGVVLLGVGRWWCSRLVEAVGRPREVGR